MSGASLARLESTSKRYEGTQALDGIDLGIGCSEILGLLGKNGAGKSTLIKILAGLQVPDSGTIHIDGEPVDDWRPASARSAGIRFVFQELEQFADLRVAENVMMGSALPTRAGIVSESRLRREARRRLDAVDCRVPETRFMNELSVIEKRQVMIARALDEECRLLVLDEPTAALTPREVRQLLDLCVSLRQRGKSVLYVSHRLDEVAELCDRVVVLRDGRNQAELTRDEITEQKLIDLIAGAELIVSERARNEDAIPPGDVVLDVNDLSDGRSFHGVDLKVHAGRALGIGGLAGSGRTEIVETIIGRRHRATGSVRLGDTDVRFRAPAQAAEAGVVMLPEERRALGLISGFDVQSNMTLSSLPRYRVRQWVPLVSFRAERRAAVPLVERLQMKIAGLRQDVAALSGGTQQKVITARALLTDARVLIMDEPTAGIDVHAKEEIYALVDELKRQGKAIIVICSDFAELVRLSDDVIVLTPEGEVSGHLSGDAVREDDITRLCYSKTSMRTEAS